MIIDHNSIRIISRMYLRVSIPKSQIDGRGRSAVFADFRNEAVDELSRRACLETGLEGVELSAADLVFEPPADGDDDSCETWVAHWEPVPGPAEFLGGPKDGTVVHTDGVRQRIRLARLSRAALEDTQRRDVLPTSTLVYDLEGYDLANRRHVYRFAPLLSN